MTFPMTRSKLALGFLLVWALLMIVPDLARVVRPLSSLGFYADSNGLIYDVVGPYSDEAHSPAWKAGLRAGDQIDLARMRCLPYEKSTCASTLAAVGGNLLVVPGTTVVLELAQSSSQPARQVTISAEPRPANWYERLVLFADEIAGIAVVLAGAWLIWTRPGPMSWGFFLYVVWFNPGQSFEYYAQLQRWPLVLILQGVAASVAQAAGYAGLLLFVMRAPTDTPTPGWERYERALPFVAVALAIALLASYGSAFGFKVEYLTRATILFGLVVSFCAIGILVLRRSSLTPKDNERLKWVLWGCLIGLPAFVFADLSEYTTLFATSWGSLPIPEDIAGLLYIVNGILCLFVFEAIRRSRVVNVAIPLRRVTLLALLTSMPALLLHQQAEHIQEVFHLSRGAWFLIGAGIVYGIGRLHHGAVEVMDRYLNRTLEQAERDIGDEILKADNPARIDHLLSDGLLRMLKLTSAATFRRTDAGSFHRYENSAGWGPVATRELALGVTELASLTRGERLTVDEKSARAAGFPTDLDAPILAVPAASRVHCYAASFYGPHESGTDIDHYERQFLMSLGQHAADAYARLENENLRRTIGDLQKQLPAGRVVATGS